MSAEAKRVEQLDRVVIRFAGDSGDGMQLAGTQFTNTAAVLGNDIATFPDFPAEIRAPAGTLAFDFMEGTNLGPHPGRMQALVVALPDADHHTQAWTFRAGGKDSTLTLDLRRTKG